MTSGGQSGADLCTRGASLPSCSAQTPMWCAPDGGRSFTGFGEGGVSCTPGGVGCQATLLTQPGDAQQEGDRKGQFWGVGRRGEKKGNRSFARSALPPTAWLGLHPGAPRPGLQQPWRRTDTHTCTAISLAHSHTHTPHSDLVLKTQACVNSVKICTAGIRRMSFPSPLPLTRS